VFASLPLRIDLPAPVREFTRKPLKIPFVNFPRPLPSSAASQQLLPSCRALVRKTHQRPAVQAGRRWFVFLGLFLALALLPVSAWAWPTSAQWLPIYRGGVIQFDSLSDANGPRNIVGDATTPSGYIFNDGIYLHFRLRLDQNPVGTGGQGYLQSFGWGFVFDTNLNGTDYEWLIMVDGIDKNESILLQQNTIQGTINDPSDKAEVLAYSLTLAGNHQINLADSSFNGDPDYFLDFRFPYDIFKQYTGLLDNSPLRIFGGSSSNAQSLSSSGGDLLGGSDLLSGFSDYITPLGTTPTTGAIRFVANLAGTGDVTTFNGGDQLFLRVDDADQNYNPTAINTVNVTLTSLEGDAEQLVLYETGVNTGIFTGVINTVSASTITVNNGVIQVTSPTTVTATYVDAIDANLQLNQPRSDSVANAAPQLTLAKAVSHATAPPGTEITYTISYHNIGGATAHTVVIMDSIPPHTTYVPGSLRIGNAASTYDTASSLTDAAGDDEGTHSGNMILFIINSLSANDFIDGSGADEGKVFFKVKVD